MKDYNITVSSDVHQSLGAIDGNNYDLKQTSEFNPSKSINTQARSIAIVKLMIQLWGEVLDLTPEQFMEFHSRFVIS